MTRRTRDEHLFGPGPKRILALDGGGVRGALTLEYLARIEALLRARHGDHPDFRLSDYFDLIGGTSTGSIIATGLALGFPVSRLQTLYRDLATDVFEKPPYRFGVLVPKFGRDKLITALRTHFGDETLGSDALQTGLMIMTKRLDTGSPWPLHNNPRGRYYEERKGRGGLANKRFLLRQVVRASTAAPHYFEPERLKVSTDEAGRYVEGAFVDGGVSPSNNPSLQMFMLATLKGFGLGWTTGADQLLLVSVGTGSDLPRLSAEHVVGMTAVEQAARSLAALMNDCDALVQTMMQWMSSSATAAAIDREVGDLSSDLLAGRELLSYLRYNVTLDSVWLKERLGLDRPAAAVEALCAMDRPANVPALAALGAEAAAVQVDPAHFPRAFDVQQARHGGAS